MSRIIYAKTDSGVDGFMKVMTTLRKRTYDIQDAALLSQDHGSNLRFVIRESPDRTAETAVGYLKQIYDIYDIHLV